MRMPSEDAALNRQVLQMVDAMAGFGATPAAEMAVSGFLPSAVDLTQLAAGRSRPSKLE